jgi:hypothetical protein
MFVGVTNLRLTPTFLQKRKGYDLWRSRTYHVAASALSAPMLCYRTKPESVWMSSLLVNGDNLVSSLNWMAETLLIHKLHREHGLILFWNSGALPFLGHYTGPTFSELLPDETGLFTFIILKQAERSDQPIITGTTNF